MIILIDMDEVLCKFGEGLRSSYNRKYSNEPYTEEFVTWELPKKLKEHFHNYPTLFFYLEPEDGAIEGINKLIELKHDVYIVKNISANRDIFINKWGWIKMHLPDFNMDNFITCSDKTMIRGDIIFDDCPHYLHDRHNIYTVAMDKKYNKGIKVQSRINSWNEFIELVDFLDTEIEKAGE